MQEVLQPVSTIMEMEHPPPLTAMAWRMINSWLGISMTYWRDYELYEYMDAGTRWSLVLIVGSGHRLKAWS